jgi:phosphatidylglycerophosphate synthase
MVPLRLVTRANALSLARAFSAPFLALGVAAGADTWAAAAFAFAVVTDFADGRLARRYNEASPMGGLLDHTADACFVTVGLAALARAGRVPWALPVLVMAAFLQYVLDSRAGTDRPLRASTLGRWNGIAYFVALGVPVVRDGLGLAWPPDALVLALAWTLVATTLVSMGDRLLAARRSPVRHPG